MRSYLCRLLGCQAAYDHDIEAAYQQGRTAAYTEIQPTLNEITAIRRDLDNVMRRLGIQQGAEPPPPRVGFPPSPPHTTRIVP